MVVLREETPWWRVQPGGIEKEKETKTAFMVVPAVCRYIQE